MGKYKIGYDWFITIESDNKNKLILTIGIFIGLLTVVLVSSVAKLVLLFVG